MRNVTVLSHPDDIHHHILERWQTEHFREAHQQAGSRTHTLMQRVADYPIFFYDHSPHPTSDTPLRACTESKHFSPWWGGVPRYQIANATIHDTCWLHDLAHKAFMTYLPAAPTAMFHAKMRHQEVMATIASSFAPYFDDPDLRTTSFDFPLLADRFLHDASFMRRWHTDPDAAQAELEQLLYHAARHDHPDDPLLQQVHLYGRLNGAWMEVWQARYRQVEQRMAELQRRIALGADRAGCMDAFMGWLTSDAITEGSEIPFLAEATAYMEVYLRLYPTSIHQTLEQSA